MVIVKTKLNRALTRLAEQEMGNYPFKTLHKEATAHYPLKIDCATYIVPGCVRPNSSQRRRLSTTREVKAGDLLLCEKAFSYAFYNEVARNQPRMLLMNTDRDSMAIGLQVEIMEKTVQKLYKKPYVKSIDVSEVDVQPIVDT
ncbi:uncharacterized protein N7529_004088 [Penicillium soppii]|uniref:uncharacterized protein n=1 Tax=Penicillium soppii TaxID=69789 RepID=UPI0025495E59|nr:uncharacterized protein N7529_004088 [Penicillium soppii]KAJ5871735.1 hypothetical protein N7529_004088 [Penicillium soppii]